MKYLVPYCLIFAFASCAAPVEEPKDSDGPTPEYLRAFALLDERKADSAFVAFSLAKEEFAGREDGLWAGSCLVQMAIILTNHADYFGGQETSLEALTYLDTANVEHAAYVSANFNNLGIATYSLEDYTRALDFYESAIRYSPDSLNTLTYLNNKARIYHNKKEYDKAIALYTQIEEQTKARPRDYARLLTNLTLARSLKNPGYDAAPTLLAALRIREEQDDISGQNSSYMHLSDFYAERRTDSALFYARKFYRTSLAVKNADDQLLALRRLIQLNTADSAKRYFEVYTALADSVRGARAAAKNQFALIRYEVEKSKADNLRLMNDNMEKAYQVTKQRIWLGAVISLLVIAGGGGLFWYRKREQRLMLQADNRMKEQQLRTSKKIHDVVANGLYRAMVEIENREELDRDGILDRLEHLYEKSRDISYETEGDMTTDPRPDTHERVTGLLRSFATTSTKVLIVGNAAELWHDVPAATIAELEHVLQELMVNMRRHSQATDVVVRFERPAGLLRIAYTDNGVGLPADVIKGNGLVNTDSRMAGLNGRITFASEGANGLKIEIIVPVV